MSFCPILELKRSKQHSLKVFFHVWQFQITENLSCSYLTLKTLPKALNLLSLLKVFLLSSPKKDKIKRLRKGKKLTRECSFQPDL